MIKISKLTAIIAAFALLGTFLISLYIALYDTTLAQEDPLHHEITWVLGIISLAASAILVVRPKSFLARIVGGIAWPALYLFSLAFDVETDLCYGNNNVHCWPSVSDSYKYLILNERVEGWVLSPYTSRALISLLIIAIILSTVSIVMSAIRRSKMKKATGFYFKISKKRIAILLGNSKNLVRTVKHSFSAFTYRSKTEPRRTL